MASPVGAAHEGGTQTADVKDSTCHRRCCFVSMKSASPWTHGLRAKNGSDTAGIPMLAWLHAAFPASSLCAAVKTHLDDRPWTHHVLTACLEDLGHSPATV